MLEFLWLIPAAPLLGFALVGYLGITRRIGDRGAHTIAVGASALAFVLSLAAVIQYAGLPGDPGQRFAVTIADWMPLGDVFVKGWAPGTHAGQVHPLTVGWTFAIDNLTCVMLLVVTGIGTLIHVYATGYMKGERAYFKFFAYLNLFMAMMLTLVLAGNFMVLFVGWEGVGLCSYLLIGFYYDRMFDRESGMSCADCGRKAFVTNRIGDFGFILGVLLLLVTFGTFDFADITAAINAGSAGLYGSALLTGIGILLFVGATGKSAQIPLFVWLPDAMAGPTPVSALIHAATMVTAGVYMLSRMAALYWHAPGAMLLVAAVGCLTAVFAGSMGMAQYDIKKVLAYSTVSQLGYMFLGVGVGAFGAAVFHLVTHAFFKACLFLGAGSVISAAGHSNDMRHYGGLRKFMPLTARTFLIATLAISGFPFLSGFMSKDEILAKSLLSNHGVFGLWIVGTIGAVMTSFYMFRCYFMTFEGESRTPAGLKHHGEVRESPRAMTWVLAALAAGAIVVGFIGIPTGVTGLVHGPDINWLAHKLEPVVGARGVAAARPHGEGHGEAAVPGGHGVEHAAAVEHAAESGIAPGVVPEGARHPGLAGEWGLFLLAIAVFGSGFLIARNVFTGPPARAAALGERFALPRRLLYRKWFVDEAYEAALLGPFRRACDAFYAFDRWVVDGVVNGTARLTLLLAHVDAGIDRWGVDQAVDGVGALVTSGSRGLRRIQSGYVQSYAATVVVGAFVLVAAYVLFTR
jgi:NADH-quinone oxidoreductase subunit L